MNALSNMMLETLGAKSPHPDNVDTLQLFGQFVGSWDFEWILYHPDGTKETGNGEWHFSWVLEGRAIQDVWILQTLGERKQKGFQGRDYGTTLRYYDPSIDAWRVVWTSPINNRMDVLIAHQIGDEIVLEDINKQERIMQWIFSNITSQSFRWRCVISGDGGNTWQLIVEMYVRRRR